MATKIKKSDLKRFKKGANALLLKHGFKTAADPLCLYSYNLDTVNNSCNAKPDISGEYTYTVFFRLDRPLPDFGNPFTGKCNFHETGNADTALELLEKHILDIKKRMA